MRSKTSRRRRQSSPFWLIARVAALLLLLLATATTAVLAAGVGASVAAWNYFTQDLPDFTDLERLGQDLDATFETTKIYAWGDDANGDGARDAVLIYEIIDPLGGDRQWIPLAQVPPALVNATVAIEDRTFWSNSGFDLQGIGRAFYEYVLLGGTVQGGSSITQQVIKNNLIEPERRIVGSDVGFDDYQRKIEEVILSARISRVYTKEQIMEWYLNTNFYGNLAYGIEAAARVYFNKTSTQLTLAEAAMLAAIPQSPAYNPIDNPEQAKQRQEVVLHAMFREGYIDRDMLNAAKAETITVAAGVEERFDIIAPHFAFYVRRELEERFGRERVVRGGLRVFTSLDLTYQTQAECVARAHIARLSGAVENLLPADELERCDALEYLLPLSSVGVDRNVNNAAVIMLDPRTAEIKAMVGSLNYWDAGINGRFNVAVDGLRQPGSAFKPFTYATAMLQKGYTAATMLLDVETDFGTPYNGIAYVPQNYDRDFHGPMRLREALANSYNVPAVEALSAVGVDSVVRMAHRMGITTLEDAGNYGLTLTLGGGEVKLIDMAYAFSVFANRGLLVGQPVPEERLRFGYRTLDPVAILRVENRRGDVLYEYTQPESDRILSQPTAFIMNSIMSDSQARCPEFGCPSPLDLPDGRPAAAKTGTTNDYRDSWTIGYTPQLVTGVWIGNTDNSPMDELPGSLGAAYIWRALMGWALQDQPKPNWLPPVGVIDLEVCELNGMLPSTDCPTVREYFVEGTQPTAIDNMYQRFRINSQTGRLATVSTPAGLVREQVFIVYPDRARDWVREQNLPRPPDTYDPLYGGTPEVGPVAILQPAPFAVIAGRINVEGNANAAPDQFNRFVLFYAPADRPNETVALTGGDSNQRTNSWLGNWDTTRVPDGAYQIILRIFNWDNVVIEERRTQVTVDNTPPTVNITFPETGQQFAVQDEFVVIQAQVDDNFAVNRVAFYVDGSQVPFAISTVPPFTERWDILGPGCRNFRVEVTDAANNRATSENVQVCFFERE